MHLPAHLDSPTFGAMTQALRKRISGLSLRRPCAPAADDAGDGHHLVGRIDRYSLSSTTSV